MKFLLVFTFCFVLCCGSELPSFIPKCSLKDPNLNGCIKDKANIAIPNLVKGLQEFGIPVMSPIKLPEIKLGGKNLPIVLTDVYTDDFKKIRLTKGAFDLKTKKDGFTAFIDEIVLTGTYKITSGKILTRAVSGTGKFNMKLVGNTIVFKSDITASEKNGEQYITHVNPTVDMKTDRASYTFENLKSSDGGADIAAYVNEQWKVIRDELKPSLEVYLLQFITAPLNGFTKNLPLNKIFLP